MEISELNQHALRKFRSLFAALPVPDASSLLCKYGGTFVGPAWLRMDAKPVLLLAGLGGWWGKDIF